MNSKQISLKTRPMGLPTAENFQIDTVTLPAIGNGELLVKNLWMSVDPYMRGRMVDRKSYVPPFALGDVMEGGAIGEIIESNHPDFPVGGKVNSMLGWRTHFVSNGKGLTLLPALPINEAHFLGALGMPGMTAWTGLNRIGKMKSTDTVLVSAASGAVGSIACQLAKIAGATVIATVGSDEKAAYIRSLGVEHVINYKTCGNLTQAISEAAPKGIDLYFENVGGDHLTAALNTLKPFGRIAVCGMISQYNDTAPVAGPANLANIIGKRLTLSGFIVSDHWDDYAEFSQQMGAWLISGAVSAEMTVYEGIENAATAFIGLFEGKNTGKMVVKLAL